MIVDLTPHTKDMNTDTLNEIRNLLGRYYNGECTPAERSRLAGLLASAPDLPADLEPDRKLFGLLEGSAADSAAMPPETESRITAALEAEMAAARKRPMPLRRIMLRIASIAACMLLAVTVLWYYDFTKTGSDPHAGKKAPGSDRPGMAEVKVPAVADTMIMPLPSMPDVNALSGRQKPVKKERMLAAVVKTATVVPAEPAAAEDSDAAEPEVDEWIAENYRVIDDPREADAIVGSVLAVMQSNLVFDEVKVASACSRMGSVIPASY